MSPPVSLALVVFAEAFCSLGVAAGFLTRLAAVPPIVTMAVAGFVIHADDPWQRKELAFVYLAIFVTVALAGAGRYSVDGWIARKKAAKSAKIP